MSCLVYTSPRLLICSSTDLHVCLSTGLLVCSPSFTPSQTSRAVSSPLANRRLEALCLGIVPKRSEGTPREQMPGRGVWGVWGGSLYLTYARETSAFQPVGMHVVAIGIREEETPQTPQTPSRPVYLARAWRSFRQDGGIVLVGHHILGRL